MKMEDEMQNWETREGVKFLKIIGIKTGQTVLDFGARTGHYSIPAAIIVGNFGLVYAIDKEQQPLDELKQKTDALGISNIKIIKNSGEVKLNFINDTIDVVLLYDILHYFKPDERSSLYAEVHRVLKLKGLLSVYPKHVIEDYPLSEFQGLHFDDIKQEIQKFHFLFNNKYCGELSHDDSLNPGCVLNFKKTK